MGKIEPLHQWDAYAALYSAIEEVRPEDKVIVLIEYADGGHGIRSANCTFADVVFMLEKRKAFIFSDSE